MQPTLPAIDTTAAHCDSCCPRASPTNRIARSRSSGENFVDFLMAPFSQVMEPPQKPGRFSIPRHHRLSTAGRVKEQLDGDDGYWSG